MKKQMTTSKAKLITKTIFILGSFILMILSVIGIVQTIQLKLKNEELESLHSQAAEKISQNQNLDERIEYYSDDTQLDGLNEDVKNEYGRYEHGLTEDGDKTIFFKEV